MELLHNSDRHEQSENDHQSLAQAGQLDYHIGNNISFTFVQENGSKVLMSERNIATSSMEKNVQLYSSDQIDRGNISGLMFHPLTGQFLEKNRFSFDEKSHCLVFLHPESIGWAVDTSGRSEKLPRIGDGNDHIHSDFPLAHWKFDHRSGALLIPTCN